jgi:hypothetical protein
MPKYFFHLMGDVPAHDLLGHECTNDKAAEEYGKMLARDVGTDKPQMIRDGNYIAVANKDGNEIAKIPLRSMSA